MAKYMKISACVALFSTIILIIFYQIKPVAVILPLAITAGTTSYHLWMRLFVGHSFKLLLKNQIDYKRKWFTVGKKEQKLYEFLRVKRWKKHLPTYDPDAFDKRQHSWHEIIMAMCQSELVHEMIVVLSFVPIVFSLWFGATFVFIFTSLLSATFDLLFVIIQRYNRPRVLKIIK